MQDKLTDYIYEVTTPLVSSLGLQLWGIEIIKAGRLIVKIFVELHPDPVKTALEFPEAAAKTPEVEKLTAAKPTAATKTPTARSGGVSIDQCAELSRLVGLTLDVEDHLDNWVLEVSSPGLDRIFFNLEQLKGFIGQEINASLMASPSGYSDLSSALGRKKFQGFLTEVTDKDFCIKLPKSLRHEGEPEDARLPWSLVRQVRLVAQFPEVVKPGKKPKQKSFDYLD